MTASMVVAISCDSTDGCGEHFWTGSADPDLVRSEGARQGRWTHRWDDEACDYCDFCPEHS